MIMTKQIYLAGGCFWGTQHFLKQIRGILSTAAGYANGNTENPTYKEVYTDLTGYAETVSVEYDADVISLSKILDLYFFTIDPTALNHQGEDFGTRYRTGIYYTSEEDLPTIREAMEREAAKHDAPLAVEVEPLKNFYAAEEYHQDYLDKNPAGYCHIPLALMAQARKANE